MAAQRKYHHTQIIAYLERIAPLAPRERAPVIEAQAREWGITKATLTSLTSQWRKKYGCPSYQPTLTHDDPQRKYEMPPRSPYQTREMYKIGKARGVGYLVDMRERLDEVISTLEQEEAIRARYEAEQLKLQESMEQELAGLVPA